MGFSPPGCSAPPSRGAIEANRDKHPGRLRTSVKGRATAYSGRVEIGRAVVYAKPIVFGWRKHGIVPHPFPHDVLKANAPTFAARYQAALAAALKNNGGA